jgi:hypothetical protein
MEEESEKTEGSDPLRRFGSGLEERAREEFCQPLWVGEYLFIDVDHSLRSKARWRGFSVARFVSNPAALCTV